MSGDGSVGVMSVAARSGSFGGRISNGTTAGSTAYARHAFAARSDASAAGWFRWRSDSGTTSSNGTGLRFFAGGTRIVDVYRQDQNGQIWLRTRTAAGTHAFTNTGQTVALNSWTKLGLRVVYNGSGSVSRVVVSVDDVDRIDASNFDLQSGNFNELQIGTEHPQVVDLDVDDVTVNWSAGAGTSTVTVGATVLSATSLSATACASGTAGVTNFGLVLPGAATVTPNDCAIAFSSTNDTAMLHINQADGLGSAMFRPTVGTLDGGFVGHTGTGAGKVSTNIGASDRAYAIAMQPDGKLVTAGYATVGGTGMFAVARYDRSGVLDPGFGNSGITTTDIPGLSGDAARAVALQSDGRIVVVGYAGGGTAQNWVLARYTAAGALDTSFGCSSPPCTGYVSTDVTAGRQDDAYAVALQGDGKIVVAGMTGIDGTSSAFAVARYTTSGLLDTTFGTNGITKTLIGADFSIARAVALDSAGRAVLAGTSQAGTNGYDVALARYTTSGQLDDTFGCATPPCPGVIETRIGSGEDRLHAISIPAGGKIIVGGYATAATRDALVARFDPNGVLDTSFNGNGWRTFDSGAADEINGIVATPEGTTMAVGYGGSGQDYLVLRYDASGTLDTSFNSTGSQLVDTGGSDRAQAISAADDGHVTIAGHCTCSASDDISLIRYEAAKISDYSNLGVAGDTDWSGGANMFGSCLRGLSGSGGAASWTIDPAGTCSASDSAPWYPVARKPGDAGSRVGAAQTPGQTVTANVRFGVRMAGTQLPGAYVAPVTISVMAPNVP